MIYSTNKLISGSSSQEYQYSAARGIKTGTTTPAGLCFASCAEIDGKTYFGVIMGANAEKPNSQFEGMVQLFKFAPTAYTEQKLVDHSTPICEIPVRLGKDKDSVNATPSKDYYAYLPNNFDIKDVQYVYEAKETLNAPVERGDVVGTITFSYEGREYVTMDLVADSAVEQSLALSVMDKITDFFSSGFFRLLVAALLALIIIFAVWAVLINRKRRRSRYGSRRYTGSRRR
jgi:D-alanyl-D-alanine carboxypeptidase (penicillin-binding protein 5/6)